MKGALLITLLKNASAAFVVNVALFAVVYLAATMLAGMPVTNLRFIHALALGVLVRGLQALIAWMRDDAAAP